MIRNANHLLIKFLNINLYVDSLAAEDAICTFHTLEKNTFKDLQPPEKSDLQYKCLVLILFVCLFELILYIPSTTFQLNRDGSSWVEPVLS